MTPRHILSLKLPLAFKQLATTFAVVVMLLAVPVQTANIAYAAPIVPAGSANSVVPPAFSTHMSWSEEGTWHWVTLSYDGTQRFTGTNYDYSVGKPLPAATYVATRVRTLSGNDSCADCIKVAMDEEGPPSILGGPGNPALTAAYAHLDNGPRKLIDTQKPGVKRWTRGSWYLNYSPITRTFFSWTWVPDDGGFEGATTAAELSTSVTPSFASLGSATTASVLSPFSAGSRVFPLVGSYVMTQPFGCVPLNSGYPSPSFCPADRPSFHDGVDLAAPLGTPIVAAASGTVIFAGVDSTASKNPTIIIDHNGANAGYETVYLHWEKSFVKVGDHVGAGEVIAAVGSVGYSTGPHLHFSVRVVATNTTIDPIAWLAGSIQFATSTAAAEPAYAGVMQWQSLIVQASRAHNVPAGLLAAIMSVESGGNPSAVSPAGALGLMQMMPSQLTRLGVPQAKWTDPASNIDAAARYLAETLGTGGTLQDAVARYFGSGCDVLGTCTQDYVSRVLTLYVYFTTWLQTGTAPSLTSPIPSTTFQTPNTGTAVFTPGNNTGTSTTQATTNISVPTPAASPATTPTAVSTPSPTPSATPSPTPTATPVASSSPTSTAGNSATPTPATTPSPTPVATSTQTSSANQSPNPSSTPTPTATPAAGTTPTATPTATKTPTPNAAATTTPVPTNTSTPSASQATAPTPSIIATTAPSATPTPSTPVTRIVGPLLSELLPPPAHKPSTPTASPTGAAPSATPTSTTIDATPTGTATPSS